MQQRLKQINYTKKNHNSWKETFYSPGGATTCVLTEVAGVLTHASCVSPASDSLGQRKEFPMQRGLQFVCGLACRGSSSLFLSPQQTKLPTLRLCRTLTTTNLQFTKMSYQIQERGEPHTLDYRIFISEYFHLRSPSFKLSLANRLDHRHFCHIWEVSVILFIGSETIW